MRYYKCESLSIPLQLLNNLIQILKGASITLQMSSSQQNQSHRQQAERQLEANHQENDSPNQAIQQQRYPAQPNRQSAEQKSIQNNNKDHKNSGTNKKQEASKNQAISQSEKVTAKKMDISAQHSERKQHSQQQGGQNLLHPTDDDISQFIISIKSSFKAQVFQMLKKFGKNIVNRIQPQTRQPALYFAGVLGDQKIAYELMDALLKYGANPHFRDQHQQTVLYYVCREGREKCIELLLDNGLKIENQDAYGQSPIYYAVSENRLGVVEKFANSKELLNHKDKLAGQTPLFYAAKKGHLQMAKLLLAKGSDATITDAQGKTAGQIAKRAKFPEVAEILLGELKKTKDQNKSAPQSEERINPQNQSSQIQESKRANKKKETAAPKQSYKIVLMKSNGQLHDLTQQEVRQLVKGNQKLESYLANPDSIPQQEIDTSISQESWEKVAQKLLSNCWKLKGAYWFHEPVDPVKYNIMDYFDIISKPMDLGNVKKKLNHNVYQRAQDFVDDMRLVWQNCYRYNGEHHDISKCAKEIETAFEEGTKNFGLVKYL